MPSHQGSAVESQSAATLLDLAASCFVGDPDAATALLVERARRRANGYVCLCNSHVLTLALHDVQLRRDLGGAAVRLPDGAPVAWLQRVSGSGHARRIGGPDLLTRLLDAGRAHRLRHLFVGSTAGTLELLKGAAATRFPGADVVGLHAPPYAELPEIEESLVELAVAAQPHFVWVGLGAPKQELWMARAAPAFPGATLIGVGAAFDFLAGTKRRAPVWMQKAGLEWLHRMASEPRRLTARPVRSNTEFIRVAGIELARQRLAARAR
jgi:N-acetylglucosaminyldiphosphoundecaprenol N-acetyl-beta-D-mannosaminyltransferase